MTEIKNNLNNEVLNQILSKLDHIEEELQELKHDKERHLWKKSIENSLSKTWDNKLDNEWSKLL